MRKIERLKQETRQAAKFRGHTLGKFRNFDLNGSPAAYAECTVCGKWVQVETRPAPNSIEVGGPAIAVGCKD